MLTMPWNRRSASSISSMVARSASNSFWPFARSARAEAISQRPRSLAKPAGLIPTDLQFASACFSAALAAPGEEREVNRGQ